MRLQRVGCALVSFAAGFAQAPATQSAGPRFEVVSIKPVPRPTPETIRSGASRITFEVNGARVLISGFPASALLPRVFQVPAYQVDARKADGTESFEIQATLPAGASSEQVPEMLLNMLVERFKFAYHRETREYQLNVLTVGNGGMKLPRLPTGTPPAFASTPLANGGTRSTQTGNVASLFAVMNSFGGLQMVDETDLDGLYTWVRDLPPPTPGMSFQEAVQDSFQAMIEAAGLKLETRKIPKETIVVDHLEKIPTEN